MIDSHNFIKTYLRKLVYIFSDTLCIIWSFYTVVLSHCKNCEYLFWFSSVWQLL